MGDFEKAHQNYLTAIKLNSSHSESYRGVTIMKKIDLQDNFLLNLQKIKKEHEKNND